MTSSDALFALLYRSKATEDLTARDVYDICEVAGRANAEHNITGVLLCTDESVAPAGTPEAEIDTFVQWLEGPEDDVRALYANILKDPRHTECVVLAEGLSTALLDDDRRLFPEWSMRFERVESLPLSVNGVRQVSDLFLFG